MLGDLLNPFQKDLKFEFILPLIGRRLKGVHILTQQREDPRSLDYLLLRVSLDPVMVSVTVHT